MRDQETTLDWFNVRHMSGAQGRFQSVGPANAGANSSDPQTWNAYAYVGNNPLSYTDPSGMIAEAGGGGTEGGIAAVDGIEDLFKRAFGGGGSKPGPVSVPFTGPTWSVTGWETVSSEGHDLCGGRWSAQVEEIRS
jgi:RHS repeat-associated protein